MNIENESLPVSDDVQVDGPSEQELLDAVMASSQFTQMEEVPLPEEEMSDEDPAEAAEEDPEAEDVVSEDEEEVEEEEVEESDEDDTSTQEADVFTSEDLDLEAKVRVTVDGEDLDISFGDLIKGYSTDQSLSKKGRELGEARKMLEAEREERLAEVVQIGEVAAAQLMQTEGVFARQYKDLEEKIDKARADGDTYEVNELKDKREQVQKRYWDARRRREGMAEQIAAQKAQAEQETWNQQIDYFNQTIPTLIPDFNEEVAGEIRNFAIEEGINPDILNEITDPVIVKFVDDYRRLKQGVSKGEAKRKATKAKRVPAKKATPPKKKEQDRQKMVKARAFREDASSDDHMDFLRQHASKTLNL